MPITDTIAIAAPAPIVEPQPLLSEEPSVVVLSSGTVVTVVTTLPEPSVEGLSVDSEPEVISGGLSFFVVVVVDEVPSSHFAKSSSSPYFVIVKSGS